ncbi:uncharacterized protein [Antedon mediterranea]|uniref:uncharacterized protein n=1 Tax=Antedon mediterranea TaxID=105859 RepID=UPI003AF95C78
MAYGLDTDTFLNAFHRFVSRRGKPEEMMSDNGTHFVGADRELKGVLKSLDNDKIQSVTVVTGAEGIINSRPLTYQSASVKDVIPLTPNHCLPCQMGGNLAPESIFDTTVFNPRKQWRRVQELMRHFWNRWLREWLPALNKRKKWREPKRDLRVDEVVLVVQKGTVRGQWPLGRIKEIY